MKWMWHESYSWRRLVSKGLVVIGQRLITINNSSVELCAHTYVVVQYLSLPLCTCIYVCVPHIWPPLWSTGQSSWLQIQTSGFDYRRYQILWVVGLKRGPPSLVSTIEDLLERKSSSYGLANWDYGCRRSTALTTRHPSIRKSWH
jgi:hypothetical protein